MVPLAVAEGEALTYWDIVWTHTTLPVPSASEILSVHLEDAVVLWFNLAIKVPPGHVFYIVAAPHWQ